MSESESMAVLSNDEVIPFLSLASLRAGHRDLLQTRRDGPEDAFYEAAHTFIQRGRAAGAYLDEDEARWEAQNLLDYWENELFRAGQDTDDALLIDFDPALQPEIPDHLCPYVGLDAFQIQNEEMFYGRSQLVAELIEQVTMSRLVGVIGPSGSGKSSVVLAGLLPRLQSGAAIPGSDEWHYFPPLVPGSAPLANLARLIVSPDEDLHGWLDHIEALRQNPYYLTETVTEHRETAVVITIDQFEETFTLCLDEEERQAFVNNLLNLVQARKQRHTVILTVRTDYESHLATIPVLQSLFEQNAIRVNAMTAVELREAIEKPAESIGLKFQEGLVDELIREIVGEPAALPLLQFTLRQLWERRQRNRITWESYRQLGGVSQALASTADALYNTLIPEEQVTLRRILLRLVQPSAGLEVTRNRIRRKVLYQSGEAQDRVDRVLEKLINARLIHLTKSSSANDDQVEVAHEALVRNWPRLVEWLDEERVVLRKRLRLTALAQNWESLARDSDALLRGSVLREAVEYDDLNELEREFVTASQQAVLRSEQEKEAARLRELETARQLAAEQQQRAEAERQRAEEQKQRAEAQAVAARRLRQFNVALILILIIAVAVGLLWSNYIQLQNETNTIAAKSTTDALLSSLELATTQAEQTLTAQEVTKQVATSQAQSAGRATAVAVEAATVGAATATAQFSAALSTQAAIATLQVTPTAAVRTRQAEVIDSTPEPTSTPDVAVILAQLSVKAQLSATIRVQDQMPMLYITGQKFMMGAGVNDLSANEDEFPAHEVILPDYFIDQYEVSVQQYATFLNDIGGYHFMCSGFDCVATGAETQFTYLLNNLGIYEPKTGFENYPANWITWYGAQAYCEWAGARLPTEAEWEYAARGTDGRIYPWGDEEPTSALAVFNFSSASSTFFRAFTPVNGLPEGVSPFGAYGMAGNVWEWVQDWYAFDYYASNPGAVPNETDSGEQVLRGGAWDQPATTLRTSARFAAAPAFELSRIGEELLYRGVGFRCAMNVLPES